MPAQYLSRENADGTYCHVYNRGIENKTIFNDEQDYNVFLGYLKDYLSAPPDQEATKKVFNIKGRAFRGTPHQPKNYYSKVELVAYNLMSSHFHLLVHQKTSDSLEGFIRSLCTRYSMYFNKKYQRAGSLFQGPYKLVLIKDKAPLLHLTRFLHRGGHSSYPEYLGARIASWVKPEIVLSSLKESGGSSYKDFVEKYQPSEKEKEILSEITLESESQHFEKENPTSKVRIQKPKPRRRIPELAMAGGIFLLLLTLGIRNIMASTAKITPGPAPTPLVLPQMVEVETPAEEKPKTILTITIIDKATSVNIHQQPTVSSNKIGEANGGDTFDFVSEDSEWYEIRLADGSVGFISSKYIEVIQEE